jgi:predicted DsbA family dithiol-disulfide isomerase
MLVEIWSDIVCPWCYIGKRRFESALARFEHADEVEVRWRSFELDPRAPFRRPGTMAEHLAAKYGLAVEEARARLVDVDQLGAAEGLDYRLADTKGGNTFAAHRLLHLGYEHGADVGNQLKEALLHAYFVDRVAISEPEVLLEVGVGAGLDRDEVAALLDGDRFAAAVRQDEAVASELGATGVPFFVFDAAFAVPGAQDPEVFLQTLRRAWSRSHPPAVVAAGDGVSCEGDSCVV